MRIKTVEISDEVAGVLRGGSWEGSVFMLPPGKLERRLYEQVDKVLRALGGRWDRTKKGHLFELARMDELKAALDQGEVVDRKRTLDQFFTPAPLAFRVIDRAEVRQGHHILEPSAGDGSLVKAALAAGTEFVTAVEIDPDLAVKTTMALRGVHGCGVWHADFMEWEPRARAPIDRVVMNPPFSGGQDMAHVRRAWDFLAPGGRLAAIMGPHWTFGGERASIDFRGWANAVHASWEELPAGSFAASGTGVASGILWARKTA